MIESSDLTQFYYKKSRLQQVKGFCYTYQEQSMASAAKRMGLEANTISTQIKSLEDDLKTKLFKRVKNRLIPTEEGDMFYKRSLPLIQGMDGLFEKFITEASKVEDNRVRIGAYDATFSRILIKKMKQFLSHFPETKFVLDSISKPAAYEKLNNDELDLIIYPIKENEKIPFEFESVGSFDYDLVLVLNKKHTLAKKPAKQITKKDIINSKILILDKTMITSNIWIDAKKKYDIETNMEFKNTTTWEMIKEAIRQNIGIGIMSRTYINKNDKTLITKSIDHLFPKPAFKIMVKKRGHISKACQKFIKLITSKENLL
ncbi:LysR family transcriptional regulator [Pseudomonadota bacterium]